MRASLILCPKTASSSLVVLFVGICKVLVIIKLTKNPVPLRFRCGFCVLKFCRYFTMFCDFKNIVHSLVPGESASHQAPNYEQRSKISQNTLKRCVAVAVRLRLFFQFT